MRVHRRAPPEPGSDPRLRKGDARVGHPRHPVHPIGDAGADRPNSDHATCGLPRPRADNADPKPGSARSGWVCSDRRRRGSPRSQGRDHGGRSRGGATRLPFLEEGAGRGFGGGSGRPSNRKLRIFLNACSYTLMEAIMFDILSTAELTVSASIAVVFLSLAMAQTTGGRVAVLVALGAWFVLALALGATGALSPAGGGAPALGLAVVLAVAALVSAYFAVPSVRNAMAATPLPAFIALHAIRVLGFSFIILYAEGRLPAPFAPSAGWGDVFMGATALPLAWVFVRFGARVRPLVLLWNALGVADLVVAISLGTLSAPGPLQVFVGPPDTSPMTTLPWLIIPGFLVPIL